MMKVLWWIYLYSQKHNTDRIYDKTLKEDLLIGHMGYSDHTTIKNWITLIRKRYCDINGYMDIEHILDDLNALNDKYDESIAKKNRMQKQWVRSTDSTQ